MYFTNSCQTRFRIWSVFFCDVLEVHTLADIDHHLSLERAPLTGTMHVEIPENCLEEELKQIQKVLEESIANSVGLNPEDVNVTVDPETGDAKYVISSDDPTLAEETQKALKNDDLVQNVNNAIGENSENLPEKIRKNLQIKDVNPDDQIIKEARDVIDFFSKNKSNCFWFGFKVQQQKLVFIKVPQPQPNSLKNEVSNFSLLVF